MGWLSWSLGKRGMTVWICFSDAFLSLVADKHNPDKLGKES